MRQICLNRPFLWPQAVDTIAKNRRQIREIQLQFKHFNGRRLWPTWMGEEGDIKSGFWSQPIEVHFISDQNLCRRRLLCVQQDIFWHLHGINQKRRRPPTQLYIYTLNLWDRDWDWGWSVLSTFVAIYTTQLSLVGFQRGHLINNARKLCEIAF